MQCRHMPVRGNRAVVTGWPNKGGGSGVQAPRHVVVRQAQGGQGRIGLEILVMDVHQMIDGCAGQHPAQPDIGHIDGFER